MLNRLREDKMRTRVCIHFCVVIVITTISLGRANADGGSSRCRGPWENPNLVQAIQSELAAKGYDPGKTDGLMGEKTRAAFQRWAQKEGKLDSATREQVKALLGSKFNLKEGDIADDC
jgi:hypothetical protein